MASSAEVALLIITILLAVSFLVLLSIWLFIRYKIKKEDGDTPVSTPPSHNCTATCIA
jgi:hypothetical protein